MKISKLALIALLGGALMAFGCSNDSSSGTAGSGGDGGSGGEGGTGGGAGGTGGSGGSEPVACLPSETSCMNGDIDPTEACCTLPAPPDVTDACTGSESLVNPASCTATGTTVTHRLTVLEILGDCNAGFDLDSCDGTSCIVGGLAPGEGEGGVDNALAGLAPVLVGVGGNLGGVNQAFSDALCGEDSGDSCATTTPLELDLVVDANSAEGCATVEVVANGTSAGSAPLNLSEAGCLSGVLPDIPLEISGETGSFGNVTVTATVSSGGFSGMMGATVDADTAVAIAEALLAGAGAVVGQVFDINVDLEGNNSVGCNALSATYTVGGVVPAAQ